MRKLGLKDAKDLVEAMEVVVDADAPPHSHSEEFQRDFHSMMCKHKIWLIKAMREASKALEMQEMKEEMERLKRNPDVERYIALQETLEGMVR